MSLRALTVQGVHPALVGPFQVSQDVNVKGEQSSDRLSVHAWALYRVEATLEAGPDAEQPPEGGSAWSLTMEMVADYPTDENVEAPEFDGGELSAFALLIGLPAIHPFAREAVQNMTGRLGYPPFTLEMLTPISAHPDDELVEMSDSDLEN
jgi:hypothetical protein